MKELDYLTPDLRLENRLTLAPNNYISRWLTDKTVVEFTPGEYRIIGSEIPETIAFIARKPGTVKITITSDSHTDPNTPTAFTRATHCMLFYAHGIEFDMDWSARDEMRERAGGNFKLGCIALKAWQFKLENCIIRNFGADGAAYGNQGNEVFPVLAQSWIGPGANENLPVPCVEVFNCVIEDPHFMNGGYGTAIHAVSSQPGDRFPFGTRATRAAHIHHNKIRIPGGIGLGAGGSLFGVPFGTEQAIYEHNDIEGKCMFNADTGHVGRLIVRDNTFKGAQGPNMTCVSSHVEFRGNHITLTEPFFNKVLGKHEPQWAFRFASNKNTVVDGNTVVSTLPESELMIGQYAGTNTFLAPVETPTEGPGASAEVAELKTKLEAREAELRTAQKALEEQSGTIGSLIAMNDVKSDTILKLDNVIREKQATIDQLTRAQEFWNARMAKLEAAWRTLNTLNA